MGCKIFIVEDNRFYGSMLKNAIENQITGEVELFDSGESFMNNMNKKPEIVILDHNLGTTLGIELMKQIKDIHPNVYFILLSAQESMSVAVQSFKYGAYDYVEKNNNSFIKIISLIHKIQRERKSVTRKRTQHFFLGIGGLVLLGILVVIYLK
ncbi:MAG: response regulator [Salibacteraceae bacterium]